MSKRIFVRSRPTLQVQRQAARIVIDNANAGEAAADRPLLVIVVAGLLLACGCSDRIG